MLAWGLVPGVGVGPIGVGVGPIGVAVKVGAGVAVFVGVAVLVGVTVGVLDGPGLAASAGAVSVNNTSTIPKIMIKVDMERFTRHSPLDVYCDMERFASAVTINAQNSHINITLSIYSNSCICHIFFAFCNILNCAFVFV